MEIQTIEIKYVFTEEEVLKKGRDAALKNQEKRTLEAEKKEMVADYNHRIKALHNDFEKMTDCVNNGFEMREVEAKMMNNYATNEREWYDPISGDLIKREPIKLSDLEFAKKEKVEKVNDVDAFESKAKVEPTPEQTIDENGQPTEEPAVAIREGYERLEYNEEQQAFHIDDVNFSRAGRENDEKWRIVGEGLANDVRAFTWLFPDMRGTFEEVKNKFDAYMIQLENAEPTDETPGETTAETETTDEERAIINAANDQEFADQLSQVATNFGASEITVTGTDKDGNEKSITAKAKTDKPKRVRKKYVVKSQRPKPDDSASAK